MAGYFAIFLVLLTLASGLIWLLDARLFAPKRRQQVETALAAAGGKLPQETLDRLAQEPWLAETARSIFPIIAAITILRSFLFEPFQIPSGSMMPTLLVGDFILVQKFAYDVKDPVFRRTLYRNNQPQHGDIAVFKYPENPRLDYIKRIIGLPGDRVIYRDKQFYIQRACTEAHQGNCPGLEQVRYTFAADGEFTQQGLPQRRYQETLGEASYDILLTPALPEQKRDYYRQSGTAIDEWLVPEGHYFAVGDNRDNSRDSRFFGFVHEDLMVGKAVFIWMSFEFSDNPDRVLPRWIPVGIRFERLGRIR
ncbi:signal peptidase I [Alkalimonas delamerensis]|uniref:Signal peptidase I n=1 Tax=Alkalimonas delamerensis TaxID=265981 RepID=A0ABT9GRA8_9GAMM|nr:signal peptidase I [Alkalimonas delamerensis]MDP4529211.1 signal peptidase I [Alkalimonas delamerensis]